MSWFGLDLKPITSDEAKTLLGDLDARTLTFDEVTISRDTRVHVRTTFTVWADCGDDGEPVSPLWETVTGVHGRSECSVQPHDSEQAARAFHTHTVDDLRATATRNGVLGSAPVAVEPAEPAPAAPTAAAYTAGDEGHQGDEPAPAGETTSDEETNQ